MERAEREELEQTIRDHLDSGDVDRAVTEAILGYGDEIYRYFDRVVQDDDTVADLFQEFSIDLLQGIEGFEWRSSLRTWAFRLARNARFRFFRASDRTRTRRLLTHELSKVVAVVRTATMANLRTELVDGYAQIREKLSPNERELLHLRLDAELGLRQIARVLSTEDEPISHDAVRSRYSRLKRKIREMAMEKGLVKGA